MPGRPMNPFVARVYPWRLLGPSLWALFILALAAPAPADETPTTLPPPEGATRLDPKLPVWVDKTATRVIVDGRVAIREGVLEMFACPSGTKEHESVVAVDAKAYLLHVGLLRIGAVEGSPVRFEPKYQPPSGSEIEVAVEWTEDGEKKTARAQDWVRDMRTEKAMTLPFVFAGSGFWTDPDSGKQHYLAESGDLICVSNFGSAMLDVPAPSSQSNAELWFEPYTDRIPPVDTPVRLYLSVKKKPAAEPTP